MQAVVTITIARHDSGSKISLSCLRSAYSPLLTPFILFWWENFLCPRCRQKHWPLPSHIGSPRPPPQHHCHCSAGCDPCLHGHPFSHANHPCTCPYPHPCLRSLCPGHGQVGQQQSGGDWGWGLVWHVQSGYIFTHQHSQVSFFSPSVNKQVHLLQRANTVQIEAHGDGSTVALIIGRVI